LVRFEADRKPDPHGRPLVTVCQPDKPEQTLNAALLAENHARPWT
jgi:hypothetical protein